VFKLNILWEGGRQEVLQLISHGSVIIVSLYLVGHKKWTIFLKLVTPA